MLSRLHLQRYLVTGLLTIIPLWITWWLFEFAFRLLSDLGLPWVTLVADNLATVLPQLQHMGDFALWLKRVMSLLLVLVALYLLGWTMSKVIGQRLFAAFERLLHRLPLVERIYGSVKQLIGALQTKPDGVQRVVLIEFPHAEMKAVGLVMRTLTDSDTGETLAAVYVPTTPNPTSGYLEIVPLSRVTSTDWTIDEAMNFVISGGAVAPAKIRYRNPPSPSSPVSGASA